MTARSSRSARPPGLDWEDSFYTLEERYRQLQKQLNERDEELKRWKVAARRADAAPPPPPPAGTSSRFSRASLGSPLGTATSPGSTSASRARVSLGRHTNAPSRASSSGRAQAQSPARASVRRDVTLPSPTDEAIHDTDNEPSRWAEAPPGPQPGSRLYADTQGPRGSRSSESAYVPIPSRAQPDAARAAAINEASMWGPESMLPDPSLIWGAEGSIQNYVAASALYHANEEMRNKLTEATTSIQSQQQELSAMRTLVANMQAKMEDTTQQMHHLVRERDLATQKLTSVKLTNADLEKALQRHVSEHEKLCFSLEAQITELRSRLVVGTDSNEQLSRDVRTLLNETREKSAEAMALRSKLALAESALSSQKHTNENLLVELKSLNHQLVDERKRILSLARDIQLSGLDRDRIAALENQLQRVKHERDNYECEHVRLMSDFVHITEGALQQAREEVRSDLQDWREAATHWEEVAQLLYKDIAERTQTHVRCREECEEAKAMRDTYNTHLNAAKAELELCRAKLDVVWPGHAIDTQNLSAEDVRNAFGKQHRTPFLQLVTRERQRTGKGRAATKKRAQGQTTSRSDVPLSSAKRDEDDDERRDQDGTVESDKEAAAAKRATDVAVDDGDEPSSDDHGEDDFDEVEALWGLALGTNSGDAADQVRELHEANLMLLAELQQLRASNELLQSQVGMVVDKYKAERQDLVAETKALGTRQAASQRLLERQLDRVTFLEAQVQSLRGYPVAPGAALDALAPTENVLELFLGQVVSTAAPAQPHITEADGTIVASSTSGLGAGLPANTLLFDRFFCSADFLVHEAVVTPTITGLNGFFDTTASFCIGMDALLLYYLQTRDLIVQLHRVRSDEEVQAEIQKEEEEAARCAASTHEAAPKREGSQKSASSGHTTTGSSEKMAARLYETVAEGRVSLLDLVLDEHTRQSPRPTYKGHVCLRTPEGQHLASLEFQVTARAAFTDDFQQLVAKAFADAEDGSAGLGLTTVRRANTALNSSSPSHQQQQQQLQRGSVPSTPANAKQKDRRTKREELQAWLSSASSTGSSTPHHRRPHASGHHRASGLALYPTSHAAQVLVRGWSSSGASHASSASSVVNGSSASLWECGRHAPHRTLLRATRTSAPAPPPPSTPVSAAHRHPTNAAPAPPGPSYRAVEPEVAHFTHVHTSQLTATHTIRSIRITVERVELPGAAGVTAPPPRLSCLYVLTAAQQDVRLLAPPTPHYTIQYTHAENAFNIASVSQLADLTREPLTFFLVNEDAPQAVSGAIYALAICEWTKALAHVNTPHTFRLPLLRRDTYEVVPGAALVVTLVASTQSVTAETTPPPFDSFVATTSGITSAANAPPVHTTPPSSAPAAVSTASRLNAAHPPTLSGAAPNTSTTPCMVLPLPERPVAPALASATTPSSVHAIEQAMMQLDWQNMR